MLERDHKTRALLNLDKGALDAYKAERAKARKIKEQEQTIADLKNRLERLEKLMELFLERETR